LIQVRECGLREGGAGGVIALEMRRRRQPRRRGRGARINDLRAQSLADRRSAVSRGVRVAQPARPSSTSAAN